MDSSNRHNCVVCGAEIKRDSWSHFGGDDETCDGVCKKARRNRVTREQENQIEMVLAARRSREREEFEQELSVARFVWLEEQFYNQPYIIKARMA